MNDAAAQNKSLVKIWCKTLTNVVSVRNIADGLILVSEKCFQGGKANVGGRNIGGSGTIKPGP